MYIMMTASAAAYQATCGRPSAFRQTRKRSGYR